MIINDNGISFTNEPATGRHVAADSGRNRNKRRPDPPGSFKVWTDDDYMAQIEQYKNEPYYDKLLENPWLFSRNAEFSPNPLQQFVESFGNTSARDAYYADLQNKQQQWLADTLAQYHQQEYESAPNQALLTKQAGINPALAGLANSPAAENDQPISDSPAIGGAETGIIDIANFGINLVTSIMSFAEGIQSFQANSLANDRSLLDLHNTAFDLVAKELENTISVPDDFNFDDSDKLSELVLDAAGKIDWSPYPKRVRRMMQAYTSSLRRNPVTGQEPAKLTALREELANRIISARVGRAEKQSHTWYDSDISKMAQKIGEITSKYTDEIAELENKARKYANRSASVEADVAQQTADSRIKYENQNYDTEYVNQRETELMESMYKDIYEYCGSKESGFLGKIGLLFIPLLRSFVSNAAGASFSFGRNVSKKIISGGENSTLDVFRH